MGLSRGLADPVARMNGRKAECGETGRYTAIARGNATRPDPTRPAIRGAPCGLRIAGYERLKYP